MTKTRPKSRRVSRRRPSELIPMLVGPEVGLVIPRRPTRSQVYDACRELASVASKLERGDEFTPYEKREMGLVIRLQGSVLIQAVNSRG